MLGITATIARRLCEMPSYDSMLPPRDGNSTVIEFGVVVSLKNPLSALSESIRLGDRLLESFRILDLIAGLRVRAAPRPTAGKSTRHPHTLWRSPPHPACLRPPIIPFVPNPLSSPRALTLPSTPPVLCLLLSYSDASHTSVIGVGTATRPTVSHGHNTPNTHLVLGSPQRPPHTAATQPADTTTFGALVQILIGRPRNTLS